VSNEQVAVPGRGEPLLFRPLVVRGVTFPNRVVISPMCLYSAVDGKVNDFHFVHMSKFAVGGAGLIFLEATAVTRAGRITHFDTGLYDDDQMPELRRIADFVAAQGAVPAIQLSHAGRKSSAELPWEGGASLYVQHPNEAWETVGPSAVPAEGWPLPRPMSLADIAGNVQAWAAAARRAVACGFRAIELHGAHGYLIHQFLSPLANTRNDRYGGDLAGRARFAVEVTRAVRGAIGPEIPLFFRISAVDGSGTDAWTMDDTCELVALLAEAGVDVFDCSSGGMTSPTPTRAVPRGYGFQVPLASEIRTRTKRPVMAVGLILEAEQAEAVLFEGHADLVAVAREALFNPNWALHARHRLEGGYAGWPSQYRPWLEKRDDTIARIKALTT